MTTSGPDEDSRRRSRRNSIRSYVSDLICNASNEEEFDALKIMEANPEICNHKTLVLDLAYEEFCRKREKGDPIQQSSFAKRFPEYEESLMRVFQVHQYLESFEQKKEKPNVEWPKPGDVFGGYRLVELIGRGSFAFVFIAEQLNVAERKVVLKITRNALDEIATLGQLTHPNIVQIFTVESDIDGFTAICMPLISQVTLFDVVSELHGYGGQPESSEDFVKALEFCINEREEYTLNRSKLPFPKQHRFVDAVLHVGVDIAKALAYSHRKNFLHCDIKPTNILITPDGRSMLFDFNLSAKSNSKTGRIGGTLPYMPPEQLQALVDADYNFEATPAVDIYSFGVTLYQFLTGKLPFGDIPESSSQKESAQLLLDRQQKTEISFAGVKGINKSLQKLIKQCLSFEPSRRPASAEALANQLEREKNVVKRTRRWMISNPIKALVAGSLLSTTIPAAYLGIKYVNEIPRRKVLGFIEDGKQAEAKYNFNQAIDFYQSALKLADFDRKLRYQALCRLAICYGRSNKPMDAKRIMAVINDDFAIEQTSNAKIELSLLASSEIVEGPEFLRAEKFKSLLKREECFTVDDHNNFLAVLIRYTPYKKLPNSRIVSNGLHQILNGYPNHLGANSNLYRMKWNEGAGGDVLIDDNRLQKCLRLHGDHPNYVRFLFRNCSIEVNNDDRPVTDYFRLVDRFAECGGSKEAALKIAKQRLDQGYLEKVIEYIGTKSFKPIDDDYFLRFGIMNPLGSISFD